MSGGALQTIEPLGQNQVVSKVMGLLWLVLNAMNIPPVSYIHFGMQINVLTSMCKNLGPEPASYYLGFAHVHKNLLITASADPNYIHSFIIVHQGMFPYELRAFMEEMEIFMVMNEDW